MAAAGKRPGGRGRPAPNQVSRRPNLEGVPVKEQRSLKDRLKDAVSQYGPTVVAFAQLGLQVYGYVVHRGPAGF